MRLSSLALRRKQPACTLLTAIIGVAASSFAIADNDPLNVRVMVLNFDPRVPSEGNELLRDVLGFYNPHDFVAEHVEAVARVSGGYVNYDIVGWKDIDAIPIKQDGFQYTADDYVDRWRNGGSWHENDTADYPLLLEQHLSPSLINDHLVDEVWLFGGPYFGYWESAMAGPDSFWINGPAYPEFETTRPFTIMGYNYERGGGGEGTLHALGHRTEASISHFFGGWDIQNPETLWDRYGSNIAQTVGDGPYGIGSVHYPANGAADYDYNNPRVVESTAPDWESYPVMTGATTLVSAETWGGTENGYLEYWFSHLPRAEGTHPTEGKLNNWWRYVYDFENIDIDGLPSGQPRLGPNGNYYLFIEDPGIEWEAASAAAADVSLGGYSGHLATITDSQEMDYLVALASGREGWLGGSDTESDGTWKWTGGRDAGVVFYEGGTPVGFDGWNVAEPNGGPGENHLQMTPSGKWNDVNGLYPNNTGYFVEVDVLRGDYDLSGTVDANDYDWWRNAFGSTSPSYAGADGNGDGVVDAADYTVWRDAYAMSLSTASVPEPASLGLTMLAATAGVSVGHRRNARAGRPCSSRHQCPPH